MDLKIKILKNEDNNLMTPFFYKTKFVQRIERIKQRKCNLDEKYSFFIISQILLYENWQIKIHIEICLRPNFLYYSNIWAYQNSGVYARIK